MFAVINEQIECFLVKKVQALIACNDDMKMKLAKMLSTIQLLVPASLIVPAHIRHEFNSTYRPHTLIRGEEYSYGEPWSPRACPEYPDETSNS